MELNNDFRVAVDRDTTWQVLTDLERIAPLLPGAQLQEVEGDEYRGIVKVKVGPIQAQYKGTATLIETDQAAGRMVMKASGRDTRGQGNASATITLTMTTDGDGTVVTTNTDLTISGKVAQFGRGVLADVSSKLIRQFVDNLEKDLNENPASADSADSTAADSDSNETNDVVTAEATSGVGPGTTAPTTTAPATAGTTARSGGAANLASGPRKIESRSAEPVDLLGTAGNTVLKRLGPVVGAAAVVLIAAVLVRRRRGAR